MHGSGGLLARTRSQNHSGSAGDDVASSVNTLARSQHGIVVCRTRGLQAPDLPLDVEVHEVVPEGTEMDAA